MDKLTKRYADGTYGVADDLPCGENSYAFKDLLVARLGAYENTDQTPEDVAHNMLWVGRLGEQLSKANQHNRALANAISESVTDAETQAKLFAYESSGLTPEQVLKIWADLNIWKRRAEIAETAAKAH